MIIEIFDGIDSEIPVDIIFLGGNNGKSEF